MLRRSKRAREQFHPLHQALIAQGGFGAALTAAEVDALVASLAEHDLTQRRRLPDRTVDVVVPLLRVLLADAGPDGVLEVSVDLRGPDTKDKTSPRVGVPVEPRQHQRGVHRIEQKTSVDQWFAARTRLRDRSVLEVRIVDTVVDRRITKRGSSGKLKLKRKKRTIERVESRVVLPVGRVVVDPGGTAPGVRVRVRTDGRHPTVVARAKFDLDAPPAVPHLTALLMAIGEPFRWSPPPDRLRGTA